MRFRTVYNNHELTKDIYSVSGLPDRPNFKPKYLDGGSYELVECGVIHSYDDIQSYLPSTDMHLIMENYFRTGDSSGLVQRNGFYEDITDLPASYGDLANMLADADRQFWALPSDVRDLFGQNPANFFNDSVKTRDILREHFGSSSSAPADPAPIESEVKDA